MKRLIIRYRNKKDFEDFCNKFNIPHNERIKEIYYPSLRVEFSTVNDGFSKPSRDSQSYTWKGMPEFIQEDRLCYKKIEIFIKDEFFNQFKDLLGQKLYDSTLSIWHPKLKQFGVKYKRIVGGKNGKYPIYIVSKGRADKCLTSLALIKMEVPHIVVVEPNEINIYNSTVGQSEYVEILELDMKFKDEYDTFDDLGDTKGKGPGGARNFCWDHSIKGGYKWHWVLDDNVTTFHLLNRNAKIPIGSGAIFKMTEDFTDRYDNIAISGLNYSKFALADNKYPPYVFNTRIYSMLLIRNDIPYRWRGRYNEDTDICLRVLKDGWATIQFNAFLGDKMGTQQIGGGNSDMFYFKEGTMPKSKMLEDMHPDVAKVVWLFNRWHHYVNYLPYKKNKPMLKKNLDIKEGIDNYDTFFIKMDKEIYNTDKHTKTYLEKNCEKIELNELYNLEVYEEQYKQQYIPLIPEREISIEHIPNSHVKEKDENITTNLFDF